MACDAKSWPSFVHHNRRQVTQADKHLRSPAAGTCHCMSRFHRSGVVFYFYTSTHAFVKSSQKVFRPVRVRASAGSLVTASDCIGGIAIRACNTTVRYKL